MVCVPQRTQRLSPPPAFERSGSGGGSGSRDAVAQVSSRGGEKERDEIEEESESEQRLGPSAELLVLQVDRPVRGRGNDAAFCVDAAAVVDANRQRAGRQFTRMFAPLLSILQCFTQEAKHVLITGE